MTREKAIRTINSLFPADCEFEETAVIGQKLLSQARMEVSSWKNEPDAVLFRYADLCLQLAENEALKR